tara:strand:- start:325 stop:747 length:423 start_codon:yes stop_codon:yes gene_type:complete
MTNILFLILCFNSVAIADDAVTLQKGDIAPFTGTLLSPPAAAKLLTDFDAQQAICLVEKEYLLERQLNEQNFKFNLISAELDSCQYRYDANKELYEKNIDYLQKQAITPSWEKPAWFAGGIVTGIAVMFGSAWMLDKIGN